MTRKRKNNDNLYDDCWMYILLLTTLVILLEALKTYTFPIAGIRLTYAIFPLPLIYLLANYITKKYDYKKTIAAIAISAVLFVCFIATISFALGERLILSNISGEFCGYVISQFINLIIYNFLLNNTKSPYLLVFLNYMFSLVVYYMFYTLIYLNMIILDSYWKGYFITIGIQTIICLAIAYLDKRIIRGRDIIK